jgi:glycosyltransferase involved in cell wall biosynthesis
MKHARCLPGQVGDCAKQLVVLRKRSNCGILYLVGQLGPGGLEHQLYCLLQSIDRERYRPEVVVWNLRGDDTYVSPIQKLGIPIHVFPNIHSGREKLRAFRRLVKRVRPEVIHSYSFYTNFAAWWASRGTNSIAIGSVRSAFAYDRKGCGTLLGRLSSRWPKTQIYNSRAAAEEARAHCGWLLPRHIFVVRNGLDLGQYRVSPLSMSGPVRILGVGSLLGVKRWDRLVAAAVDLAKKGFEFQIEICGGGPLHKSLKEQTRTVGVSDRVHFVGHRDNIAGALARSTFLAHVSDSEGCPNVIMEAMACSRAVVAVAAGDTPSLVDDGETGFIVRRGDDEALADRMATLIRDRSLCLRMGEAGRAKAEREFSANRLMRETLNAYRSVGWRDS